MAPDESKRILEGLMSAATHQILTWLRQVLVRTSMQDSVMIVEICQTLQHSMSDKANGTNVHGSNLLVDGVERASVHVFHADADPRLDNVTSVKVDDVRRNAIVHDAELALDLLANFLFHFQKDDLAEMSTRPGIEQGLTNLFRHDHPTGYMLHFDHATSISVS